MKEKELFLVKREISRLQMDLNRCSNPILKELIRQDLRFLCSVVAGFDHFPI